MATVTKYDLKGKQTGTVQISDTLANAEANGQMIKDYIVAIRANARQWSACTKTRAEVSHTTKKPHPQKGTGGARQGSLVSPQFRGGGRALGPKPKFDQNIKINKKERRAAIRTLIAEKIRNNKLKVIETTTIKTPKTKAITTFIENTNCKGRLLFIGEGNFSKEDDKKVSVSTDTHDNFIKSMRNIPKTEFVLAQNISGYDVILASEIVMTEAALNEITQWLS